MDERNYIYIFVRVTVLSGMLIRSKRFPVAENLKQVSAFPHPFEFKGEKKLFRAGIRQLKIPAG